jgi:tetratricopeptide (TPR) repeat protein
MKKESMTKTMQQSSQAKPKTLNSPKEETLSRLRALDALLSPFWSLRCGGCAASSKSIFILMAVLLGSPLLGPRLLLASESRSSIFEEPAAAAALTPEADVYHQGVTASKQKDYSRAMALFQQALRSDPHNPDVLNMLAFSLRKSGHLDEAFEYYRRALEIKPQFPEAREYLGEAHLQAALREIQKLRSYGAGGQEDLQDLTKAFKTAAATL